MSEPNELEQKQVKVAKFDVVPEVLREKAWELYSRAFQSTELVTPRPQPLSREKFFEIIEDPDFLKIFFGDGRDPKAMIILTKAMQKIEFWINNPFLQKYYSREFKEGKIEYVVGILTAPEVRGRPIGYFRKILDIIAEIVETDGNILLQDFSPESAPDYSKVVAKYFGDKYKYTHLDRQMHGTIEVRDRKDGKSDVDIFTKLPPELERNVKKIFRREYKKINLEAVQPQFLSESDFGTALRNPDYLKLALKDDKGNVSGFALVATEVSNAFGQLNEAFVENKYKDKEFFVLLVLLGASEESKKRIIEKLCFEAKEKGRSIYFIGSERTSQEDLTLLTLVSGSHYVHDGSQNYGVFSKQKI